MTAETDMGVAAVPRWAWVVAGLVVGLLHGSLREWASTVDPTDDYDVLLTDQGRFESALVDERLGHRLFKDVTVYPHWLPSRSTGGKRLVHLVTGSYWDGNTTVRGGEVVARWDPACFVAPVPYVPTHQGAGAATSTPGTVLDYLATLKIERGVQYRYAWWWWTARPLFTSTLAAALLIGGVWPTVVNLLAFGRLTRPPREKRPSMWRVRRGGRQTPSLAVSVVAESESVVNSVAPVDAPPPPAPLAPLATEAVAAPSTGIEAEHHYGAKPDDFYPTELRAEPHRGE
jgi:hypothetical protein